MIKLPRMVATPIAAALIVLGSALQASATTAQPTVPNYSAIMAGEAYWVSLAQVPTGHGSASGAIAVSTQASDGQWLIRPYDANIGARGMLSGGSRYYPMVRAWMQWYFNHLNSPDYAGLPGTVYDYQVDVATYAETYAASVPSYDSSDSYAATFLTLAQSYAQTTHDYAFLQAHQAELNTIGNAIQATQQPNGLTWAKADYHAAYLMDNSEVQQGLRAQAWLDSYVFADLNGANAATIQARRVIQGMQSVLWLGANSMYSPALGSSGPPDAASWSQWYPASIGQAYPIQSQALARTDPRAQQLWLAFNAYWPGWTTTIGTPTGTPGMTLCYAAAVMHDKARTDACLSGAATNWTSKGRPWPWTVLESGMMALAARSGRTL
ncbi:MAG: hypothetical protein NVSMB32_11740 [Actinomycetota bacterium]